jgi:hypothetical protein
MHADGEQTISTQLDVPEGADVVEVLNHVSMVHAALPWIGLKKQLNEGWDAYTFHTLDGLSVVTCEKNADIGYLHRDGTDEYAWFVDAKGERQASGWTPFPMPKGLTAHVQVNISSEAYGVAFTVDEGLAPIMQVLLDRGIYTEHSCECYRLSTHPFDGLFAYINVNTQHQGTPSRPNTERLRSITATELASVLGLPAPGEGAARWQVNEHDNVLLFDPAAVVLGNRAG